MSEKMKNLLVRTASGAVLAVVIFGALLWSNWSFALLLALLTVGGLHEFYALARKCGATPQPVLGTLIGLAVLFVAVFAWYRIVVIGILALLLFFPATFVLALWSRSEHPIADIAATIMGVFYVAVPFALAAFCNQYAESKWPVIGFILIVWANDVFAYLTGLAIGRHPLFPRLSPKKSWEGFAGGIAGAVGVGLLVAHFGAGGYYGLWAGLALIAAVTGVAGDLVESMFKRAAGVKDSGNLIPGHGGVLDRFDAMLLAIPFVLAYLFYLL